ncbi:MAG: F0F1 ATP synthase subunit delta [Vicinamibacterales bacterium]|nr:F0F1 ATP synthase subunit delta [Vicinamibacterales bacterium]
MPIDWFTVGAQVVNFLILVWLLKRFLYQPVLDAIDAREKRIAAELADAGAKQSEAQHERDEFQQKNAEFDQQRNQLLNRARAEADTERQRLIDEARQAADALRVRQNEALARAHASLGAEIERRTRDEVLAIARKTLMDLAGTSLEERASDVFPRRVRELGDEAKRELALALTSSPDAAVVRSAFDLSPAQQASIQEALNDVGGAAIQVRFETDPDVISGIEVTANGRKVAWSIAGYLTSLARSLGDVTSAAREDVT